jgi:hypothetical protein
MANFNYSNRIERDRQKAINHLLVLGVPEGIAIQHGNAIADGAWANQLQGLDKANISLDQAFTAYPDRRYCSLSAEEALQTIRHQVAKKIRDLAKNLEIGEAQLVREALHEFGKAHSEALFAQNHERLVPLFRLQMAHCPEEEQPELFLDFFLSSKARYVRLGSEFKEALLVAATLRRMVGLGDTPALPQKDEE